MKILIGYDGSENSDFALDDLKRAGLPKSVDATVLTVADVFLPPALTNPEDVFPAQLPHSVRLAREQAEHKLKEAAVTAKRAGERIKKNFPAWNVRHVAVANSPAWAVIQKAAEYEVDLVVVGALGHSVLGGRVILGSVSQRVLYEATTSVRIARPGLRKHSEPIRLLVGVDNSSYSEAAVEMIYRRDWPAGTEVRLVTVVDTVIAIAPNPKEPSLMKWIEVGDADSWEEIRQSFEPSADKLRTRGLDATVMIIKGDPKEALTEEAESWRADCIFVGSKGTRGLERLLLGSVASAVSARAKCTVELVRPTMR